MDDALILRHIRRADDAEVAQLIRTVMQEFGCLGPGYSSEDAEVDSMSANYGDQRRSAYWVMYQGGRVVGSGGIGPLSGWDAVCELRKMYVYPEQRGRGI